MSKFLYELSSGVEQRKSMLFRIPLLLPAIALAGGVVLAHYSEAVTFSFWLFIALAGIAGVIISARKSHWMILGVGMVCLSCVGIGGIRFEQAYRSLPENDIVLFSGKKPILATVRGNVTSYPVVSHAENEFGFTPQPSIKYLLDVTSIKTPDGFIDASGICRVTVREPYHLPSPGDGVELVGTLGRYRRPSNPGQGDTLKMSRITGTNTWFMVPTYKGARTIKPVASSSGARVLLWRIRAFIRQRLTESDDLINGQLVSALILGERQPGLRDLSRTMMRAGIAHFLSISGLHLGVFLAFVYFLCRLVMIGPRRSAIAVLVVLGIYLLLAEARAPMMRSAIMAACIAGGMAVGRKYSSFNALSLSWIILLLIDPRQLFLPGFQLSFAIVAGLILLSPKLQWLLFGWWYRRRGLIVFRQSQRVRRWLYFRFAEVMIEFITMSICAYLIATPLAMLHFGFFSPYAVVLGFILFPLVVGVLIPGYIAMALAWPMPNLAGFFGGISSWFASLIVELVHFAQRLPGLWVGVYPVNGWWVALYFAAFIAVLYSPGGRLRKRVALALVGLLIIVTTLTQLPASPKGEAELNLLSVGRGQCAVLRTPDGENWLIDVGSINPTLRADNCLLPFLRNRRLASPKNAIVSHGHPDHFSMLTQAVDKMGAGDGFTLYSTEYVLDGKSGRQPGVMLTHLAGKEVQFKQLSAGDKLKLGRDTWAEVLWPISGLDKKESKIPENDRSIVLKINSGRKSILMPGDIGVYAQKELLKHPDRLKSDAIVLPHHGGWDRTLPEFIAAVAPEVILVSDNGKIKGKSSYIKEFYQKMSDNYRMYRTSSKGWISFGFGPAGLKIDYMHKNQQ